MKLKLFENFYSLDKITIREVIQDILDEYECEVILNEYGGPGTSLDKGVRLDLYWNYTRPISFGQEIMDEIIDKLDDCGYEVNDKFCYREDGKFICAYAAMGKEAATLCINEK